jgi:hypothetical protein
MKRFILVCAALAVLLCGLGQAKADRFQTFDLTWSGDSFGNQATATGQITIDTLLLANPTPAFVVDDINVRAFSITVSRASAGDGNFRLVDFHTFDWGTNGATLDLTRELVGQPTVGDPPAFPGLPWGTGSRGLAGDFNIHPTRASTTAPTAVAAFEIYTDGGRGDVLALTSFRPHPQTTGVPELDPAGAAGALTLLVGGILLLRGQRHRAPRPA